MNNGRRRLDLTDDLVARLREKTTGSGGYQSLVQEILSRLERGAVDVDDELIERLEHYAYDYGKGGWQDLLREVLAQIEASATRR
jgi:hypothetical protein